MHFHKWQASVWKYNLVVLDKKKSERAFVIFILYTFYGHFIAVEKTHFKSIFTQFFLHCNAFSNKQLTVFFQLQDTWPF